MKDNDFKNASFCLKMCELIKRGHRQNAWWVQKSLSSKKFGSERVKIQNSQNSSYVGRSDVERMRPPSANHEYNVDLSLARVFHPEKMSVWLTPALSISHFQTPAKEQSHACLPEHINSGVIMGCPQLDEVFNARIVCRGFCLSFNCLCKLL